VKQLVRAALAAGIVSLVTGSVQAQDRAVTKTLTGEQKTVTATVEAIERATRVLTLKEQNGEYTEVSVPTDVKRFDTLKVGDKISV
jgi:hypothetical protein